MLLDSGHIAEWHGLVVDLKLLWHLKRVERKKKVNRYPTFSSRGGNPVELLTFILLYCSIFSTTTMIRSLSNLLDRSENPLRIPRLLSFLALVGPLGGMFRLNDRDNLVVAIAYFSLIRFWLVSLFFILSTLKYL